MDNHIRPGSKAVAWYKVYAWAMSLLYILVIVLGVVIMFIPGEGDDLDAGEGIFFGLLLIGMGLALAVPYIASTFLKPRPWVWILDLILICIGLTSCLTLFAALPLLIFWLKPEVKEYFGR